jgi:hypothetical protein
MMVDQEDGGLPQGLDGDDEADSKTSILFERRRQREKGQDKGKKGKRFGVDKAWILKKKEVYCCFRSLII